MSTSGLSFVGRFVLFRSTVKPRLSEQRILYCVGISEFVEVVAKINRKDLSRSLSPSNYCYVVLTTLLSLIEAIAPGSKTRNNKILQPLV